MPRTSTIEKILKGIGGKYFKPVSSGTIGQRLMDKEAGTLIQRAAGLKIKTRVGLGIVGAAGVYSFGSEGLKLNNQAKMGPVVADEMANMVSFTRSPTLDSTLDLIDSDEKSLRQFENKNWNYNNYGAEGDIVLALHNLRK